MVFAKVCPRHAVGSCEGTNLTKAGHPTALVSDIKSHHTVCHIMNWITLHIEALSEHRNVLSMKFANSYDESGTSRCLFSHTYKTHKYIVGRTYSC